MNTLCISSSMSSSEWASWVQAVGSIFAIAVSLYVVRYQSKRQYELLINQQNMARIDKIKSFEQLSSAALGVINFFLPHLSSRDQLQCIAYRRDNGEYLDLGQIAVMCDAFARISLHDLPSELVKPCMVAGATLRQFKENIEFAIENYGKLDSVQFSKFTDALVKCQNIMKETHNDITNAAERIIDSIK